MSRNRAKAERSRKRATQRKNGSRIPSRQPHFLDENTDILECLVLPHNSGNAVSLVERQVGVLRDRNKEMRARLDNMLQTAHDNDLLLKRLSVWYSIYSKLKTSRH